MSKHPLPQETEWPEGTIFTVGQSILPIERFIALLHIYGIKCLADIRTVPRSRHNPQFNGDALGHALKPQNIRLRSLACARRFAACARTGARVACRAVPRETGRAAHDRRR